MNEQENNNHNNVAKKYEKDAIYDAILTSLKNGSALWLDELKSAWTSQEVNRVVRKLALQGIAGVHRRRLHPVDGVHYSFDEGIIEQRGPGRFLLIRPSGSEAYVTTKNTKAVVSGDKVLAFLAHQEGKDTEAIPSSLMSRDHAREHLARARLMPDGKVVFFLDNRVEDVSLDLVVNGARPGDVWFVTIIKSVLMCGHVAVVASRRMGNEADKGIESVIAFETRFAEDAKCDDSKWLKVVSLQEASDRVKRRDLRMMPLVTIDGESTRDMDDAIFGIESLCGGWDVTVAIADVSAFVELGSECDHFARKKMTSVYLPHEVHPMLPSTLSTGICSLNPDEDRYALCCSFHVNENGVIEKYDFYRGLIKSHARLTYSQVQSYLDCGKPVLSNAIEASVLALSVAAKWLKEQGTVSGRLDMEEDEVSVVLDQGGKVERLKSTARVWAQKIVEECMLAANRCAAEYVGCNTLGGVFRNHIGLKPECLESLRLSLKSMGLTVGDGSEGAHQCQLAETLKAAKEVGKYAQARSSILGSMSSASYEADNKGHFSLAAPYYCHFTSPIRRYPDLVMHRLIKSVIDDSPSPYSYDDLIVIAKEASTLKKLASQAESEARKLLILDYAKQFIGKTFHAVVASMSDRGLWVKLPLPGAHMEFFVTAGAMKHAGMSWADDDQSWTSNEKILAEEDRLNCKMMACDAGSRRIDLVPVTKLVTEPTPLQGRTDLARGVSNA